MDLDEVIQQLDTVVGMLTVASMNDPVVREAKEKVMALSIALGEKADSDK